MHLVVYHKKQPHEFTVTNDATLLDLKKAFQAKFKRYYVTRQAFKPADESGQPTGKAVAGDSERLRKLGVDDGHTLVFKDLGPQFSYRGVFIIEYLGPLLFVLLYALRPALIYGEGAANMPWHPTAQLGVICWTIHFAKREFETMFVHRFSRPTMPAFNLVKNSAYYWVFGLVIGYPLCHPAYTAPVSETQVQVATVLFGLFELGNLICHVMLRNLRPAEGSRLRPMPRGFLFEYVACPNYTFEVAGWLAYGAMTQIAFVWVFAFVGFAQMRAWAVGKAKGYARTYGDEYKKLGRKPIVPFLC